MNQTTTHQDNDTQEENDRITKEEMNLVEYPVSLVSERAPKGVKTIEYRDWVTVGGVRKPLSWILTASDKFGLPAGVDQDFYIATMEVWREHGFKDQTIPIGSVYHMLTRMKIDPNGRTYRRFQLFLDRYSTLSVIAENAFWDKEGQSYRTREKFSIFDSYKLVERFRKNDASIPLPLGYIKASDILYRSVRNGNLKDLNLTLYLKLHTPLARRLYRYLDKKRYYGRTFTMNVRRLAAKLGLVPQTIARYRPADLRRLLQPALDALTQEEFLERSAFEAGKEGEKLVVFFVRPGEAPVRVPHREQEDGEGTPDAELAYLVDEILAFTGDEHSRAYYTQIVRELDRHQVYAIISETRQAHLEGKIKSTKAKYFTDLAERYRGRKPLG